MKLCNFDAVVNVEFQDTIVNHIVLLGMEGLPQFFCFDTVKLRVFFREVRKSLNSRG